MSSINICSCCGGTLGEALFSIPKLPLVDSFSVDKESALKVPQIDVVLRACSDCQTVQIDNIVPPKDLYLNYIYNSASSPDLLNHFEQYSRQIVDRFPVLESSVLEIGCNDGLLLAQLKARGYRNLTGVDPAPQVNSISLNDVVIFNEFFDSELISSGALIQNSYDLIIANNVFSHIPDLQNVFGLCRRLLKSTGTLVIEVQSLLHLLEGVVFDYVYHEHIFYHSLTSLDNVLSRVDMKICDVELVSTKGGSFRIYICRSSIALENQMVHYWKYRERCYNLNDLAPWDQLRSYLKVIGREIDRFFSKHKVVAGYGASATGTVLSKYFGIDEKFSFLIDDNSDRQGRFTPGVGVPVFNDSHLVNCDAVFVLAWRHFCHFSHKLTNKPVMIPLPTARAL